MSASKADLRLRNARRKISAQKAEIERLMEMITWLRMDIADAIELMGKFIPSNYHEILAELEALEQQYGRT